MDLQINLSTHYNRRHAPIWKAWLEQLKGGRHICSTSLVDVNKAARMILDRIQPGTDREPCTVAARSCRPGGRRKVSYVRGGNKNNSDNILSKNTYHHENHVRNTTTR